MQHDHIQVKLFLTKSEVKAKVTVIKKWYAKLQHPQLHQHTTFGIPTLNGIGDMLQTQIF